MLPPHMPNGNFASLFARFLTAHDVAGLVQGDAFDRLLEEPLRGYGRDALLPIPLELQQGLAGYYTVAPSVLRDIATYQEIHTVWVYTPDFPRSREHQADDMQLSFTAGDLLASATKTEGDYGPFNILLITQGQMVFTPASDLLRRFDDAKSHLTGVKIEKGLSLHAELFEHQLPDWAVYELNNIVAQCDWIDSLDVTYTTVDGHAGHLIRIAPTNGSSPDFDLEEFRANLREFVGKVSQALDTHIFIQSTPIAPTGSRYVPLSGPDFPGL